MAKWRVTGMVAIPISIEVEAGDEDEDGAIDAAYEQYPGLENYCGNGASSGRLIGHDTEELSIYAGEERPEFDAAEKL